ncbi:hypothetical protein TNCV_1299081 [Trichonephila clavipes]|nr:hypothetical protein TNCV_1299081 [Trichonephila clavipes]
MKIIAIESVLIAETQITFLETVCTKKEGLKSFRCEDFGHKASECSDNIDIKLDVAHLFVNKEDALHKRVLIGDLDFDALTDSGSQVALI